MNIPTFDDVQAPNIRAANEHLRRQVERIPALLRRIATLEAELQDARTVLELSAPSWWMTLIDRGHALADDGSPTAGATGSEARITVP
ncbi:hypothetical protein [Jiangella alba]|uniref:Uncharacterized protein n=1 Tax=Jiangella alba TaxID=561176 RepID=A0A1H5PZS0_9ACTN|nr:hypothetical protein [Jiangella alba]SEF18688.1 hypothetical protein SAMN04488561_6757 [Jiangella alba]